MQSNGFGRIRDTTAALADPAHGTGDDPALRYRGHTELDAGRRNLRAHRRATVAAVAVSCRTRSISTRPTSAAQTPVRNATRVARTEGYREDATHTYQEGLRVHRSNREDRIATLVVLRGVDEKFLTD
jgi:hypothetical protein